MSRTPSPSHSGEGYHGQTSNRLTLSGPPGYGWRHDQKDSQTKAGTCWPVAARQRPIGEQISRWERARSSDEAIVSVDATGQHNPTPSQGPLDRCAWTTLASTQTQCCDCPQGLQRARVEEAWTAYKPARAKVAVDTRFEAVLGKTRRTEF